MSDIKKSLKVYINHCKMMGDKWKDCVEVKHLKAALARIEELETKIEELTKVIERLGSSEAFDVSRGFKRPQDDELIARMDYAKAALKQEGE